MSDIKTKTKTTANPIAIDRRRAPDIRNVNAVREKLRKLGWRIEVVTVTPELAEKWLGTMVINRTLRNDWVDAYERDMKAGGWWLNGSCIVFSKEGEIPDWDSPGGKKQIPAGSLLDGQHRLWACVQGRCSFKTLVAYGVDPAAFSTIDTGVARKPADVFVGEKYANDIAAALRLLWAYQRSNSLVASGSRRITRQELTKLFQSHPGIRGAVAHASELTIRTVPLIPRSSLAFFLLVFSNRDPVAAQQFFDGLQTGEGLTRSGRTAAIYTLRNLLLNWSRKREANPIVMRQAATIKAWNLFRGGVTSCSERALIWQRYGDKPEAFPVIK